jgi:hypothetical protein
MLCGITILDAGAPGWQAPIGAGRSGRHFSSSLSEMKSHCH